MLASQISKLAPYELPQIILQMPPPPIDVPMPVRKASLVGENKVVNYLLHGDYELTKSSWSKLQKSITLARVKFMLHLKEKEDPEALNINKRRNM